MKKIKLGDVLEVKRGTSLAGKYYSTSGELIRLTLGNFNYPSSGFKENTSKKDIFFAGDVKPEYILKKGDIITPLTEQVRGLLGETATIPESDLYIQSGDVGLIIPNERLVDKRFCYYLLPSPLVKEQLGANAQQTKIRHTSPDKIKDCTAFLPALSIQKSIATLLDNINDKINLNNKIISELESMAKTIYDYWFLQFDFPDKNGKPYKSSGGKMVWNEELKREIPEGWEVYPLAFCISCSKNGDWGNSEPMNSDDIKVNCFRGADFSSITTKYLIEAPIRYIKKSNDDRILTENDLIVEISGGSPTQSTGRIGYVNNGFLERLDNKLVCSNFCKAFSVKSKLYYFWLFSTWKALYDAGIMFNFESKTTGIKNLMFDNLISDVKVVYPNDDLLTKYQEKCSLLYEKVQFCLKENQELSSLRDWLLPMLMNGQVTFKDEGI